MHGIHHVLKSRCVGLTSVPLTSHQSLVTPDTDESETEGFLGFTKEAVDAAFRRLMQEVPH
jgi:hypothetical protein